MKGKLGKDSLLHFVIDKSVIQILKSYTDQNSLWLREADDIVDLYACDSRMAVVEKSLLDEDLYSCLRNTYVQKLDEDVLEEFPELRDIKFDNTYIVFGEGDDIPDDMKQFFVEVGKLTPETFLNAGHQ